jgi:hypothetical protein
MIESEQKVRDVQRRADRPHFAKVLPSKDIEICGCSGPDPAHREGQLRDAAAG